jgi:uncharacterized LabA/DUF88 family protein
VSDKQQVERVFVAVDVQNIWYSCKEQFGPTARIAFNKLQSLILSKPLARIPRKAHFVAYTVTSSTKTKPDGKVKYTGKKNDRFLELLAEFGFEIRNRDMHAEKGIEKPFHTDWDVGITIDAIRHADKYDTFTLVSGDGDYAMLIEDLQKRQKYVEVITVESTASRLLHVTANRVIRLTEKELYFQEPKYGRSRSKGKEDSG